MISYLSLYSKNDDHYNPPNFSLYPQLPIGQSIPDATIGLSTYDLRLEPWRHPEWNDLIQNDRVRLFDTEHVVRNRALFGLERPNRSKKTPHLNWTPYPVFNFALWEAKKTTGDTHGKALLQTAASIKTLLQRQRHVFDEAKLSDEPQCKDVCPLVWFFSSVGSDWQLWGCYEEKSNDRGEYRYVCFLGSSRTQC